MVPLLSDGDWVQVRGSGNVRRGQLAVGVLQDGELVCHRVLDAASEGCWLAGDRSLDVARVEWPRVLGVVVALERAGGEPCAVPSGHLEASLAALHLRAARSPALFGRALHGLCRAVARAARVLPR